MLVFVSGAVRSGKSAWAEQCARHIARDGSPLVYLATARVCDQEMRERVARHRVQREDKGFAATIERDRDLSEILPLLPENASSVVLLECLGTWTANEMFGEDGVAGVDAAVEKIYADVAALKGRTKHLLIVSNDIFSDGVAYGPETENYRKALGTLHVRLARDADVAVECVAGRPVFHKGLSFRI